MAFVAYQDIVQVFFCCFLPQHKKYLLNQKIHNHHQYNIFQVFHQNGCIYLLIHRIFPVVQNYLFAIHLLLSLLDRILNVVVCLILQAKKINHNQNFHRPAVYSFACILKVYLRYMVLFSNFLMEYSLILKLFF